MVNPNRFYTYAYLREDRTPYYIGKGSWGRIYDSKGKTCRKPKNKTRIIFLKQNLTEEEAFKHEIYMIAVFGRKDLGTGILHNRTNGGDGASGYMHSQSTKEKIRISKLGKLSSFYGKTHTDDAKDKIRNRRMNTSISEETRKKLSGENNPRSQWWKLTFSDGEKLILCGLHRWSIENGYDKSLIYKVFNGKRKKHKNIIKVEKVKN